MKLEIAKPATNKIMSARPISVSWRAEIVNPETANTQLIIWVFLIGSSLGALIAKQSIATERMALIALIVISMVFTSFIF